jgi:hypothetical protein
VWRLDPSIAQGVKIVQNKVNERLDVLIRQLDPSTMRKDVRQYHASIAVSFNIQSDSVLRALDLQDRRKELEKKKYGVSVSTCQRYLIDATKRMARILASADYDPDAPSKTLDEANSTSHLLQPTPQAFTHPLTHLISLSGEVREALDEARDTCLARGRAFYTFDLLLALLEILEGQVWECFELVRPGLALEICDELRTWPDPSKRHDQFRAFEWVERSDVRLAWRYSLQDESPVVTDVHLLLAILDGSSATITWLKRYLDEDYPTLRAKADELRRDGPRQINSPTPD